MTVEWRDGIHQTDDIFLLTATKDPVAVDGTQAKC